MPQRSLVLIGLLSATLAAGLAGQAPTTRPTAPSGAPVPGIGPAPQQPQPPTVTAATTTGIIRGRVVRADTGKPLQKAFVSVRAPDVTGNLLATTDDEGRYELKGLPAGRYDLSAAKGGFVEQQFGQRRSGDTAQPVQLAVGQTIDRIDFTLSPGGVIAGTVVDDAGEPLAGVIVETMTSRYVQGVRRLITSNNLDITDDLGQFRLFGVAQGRWVIRATSPDRPPDLTGVPLRTGTVVYYPNAHATAEAQAVQVTAGTELTGLAIAIAPERLGTIVGTVRTSDGSVLPRSTGMMLLPLRDPGSATLGTIVLPDGSFAIPNVPLGRYIVAAMALPTNTVGAMTEVALDGPSVTVALTLQKGSSALGRFVFDTAEPPATLRPALVRVGAESAVSGFTAGPMRTSSARDDWTFEVTELVGPNQLRVTVPQGWAVDSIHLDGKDVTDRPLDFAGKDIDGFVVHLTQRVSVVRGQVSDQRGQKVTDAAIVLFADDPARWTPRTRFVQAVRPDGDGRFDVRGLPAARYLAVALEFLAPGEENDPETLEQLQRLGTPFALDAGGTAIVNLKVSPAP